MMQRRTFLKFLTACATVLTFPLYVKPGEALFKFNNPFGKQPNILKIPDGTWLDGETFTGLDAIDCGKECIISNCHFGFTGNGDGMFRECGEHVLVTHCCVEWEPNHGNSQIDSMFNETRNDASAFSI